MSAADHRVRQRADRHEVGAGRRPAPGSVRASRRRRSRFLRVRPISADGLADLGVVRLSSRTMSAPASAASAASATALRLDFNRQARALRRARRRRRPSATPPASRTWLSLIRTRSYSPKRWFVPPPTRTAYFSSARSVGVVLRVSSIVMRPAGGVHVSRVAVAMPRHPLQQVERCPLGCQQRARPAPRRRRAPCRRRRGSPSWARAREPRRRRRRRPRQRPRARRRGPRRRAALLASSTPRPCDGGRHSASRRDVAACRRLRRARGARCRA